MTNLQMPERGTRARQLLQQLTFSEEDKLCAQDPEQWFSVDLGGVNIAKRICNGANGWPPCPLRDICREYAIVAYEIDGVWGGTSPLDRRYIRRNRRRAEQRKAAIAAKLAAPIDIEETEGLEAA